MNPSALTLPADPSQAYLLRRVLESTTPAEESETDATARCGAILEMFKAFAAVNALQAMIACHCITLEFVLSAAMRDAGDLRLDPKLRLRARAGGLSLSRGLGQWLTKYEKLKARDDKQAAEAAETQTEAPIPPLEQPTQAKPVQAKPEPPPAKAPPAQMPLPKSPPPMHAGLPAPPVIPNALASSASRVAMLAPMASLSNTVRKAVASGLTP